VRRTCCALLAAALVGAGCGGPIEREELGRRIETLRSTAAEGSILARGTADNRTRSPYVRAHAKDLADDADHEAEKLHDAEADPPLDEKKQKAVTLAQRISNALGSLELSPGDEAAGRTAERQLNGLARQARALGDSL
jgi:hypothetical protein